MLRNRAHSFGEFSSRTRNVQNSPKLGFIHGQSFEYRSFANEDLGFSSKKKAAKFSCIKKSIPW